MLTKYHRGWLPLTCLCTSNQVFTPILSRAHLTATVSYKAIQSQVHCMLIFKMTTECNNHLPHPFLALGSGGGLTSKCQLSYVLYASHVTYIFTLTQMSDLLNPKLDYLEWPLNTKQPASVYNSVVMKSS